MPEECLSSSRENNILKILISNSCIIQNGGGLTADTYKYVEKIGVFDRTQAAVYAIKNNIVELY